MSNPDNNSGSGGLPAAVVTGVLGLALGVGGTILGMTSMGYTKTENAKAKPDAATAPGNGPPGGMMGGGMPGGGMMGGGGGMMGGGGAANQDENPFTQETHQKKLKDLLDRLKPAG
ncbi:MAG: hypothetical protein ACK6D3_24880 [Planctomycetaceae bacterium]